MKRRLRELFTRDLGRKLLALLFAVVLFDVLDRQVQGGDRKAFSVVYVDERDAEQLPDDSRLGSVLVVAERPRGGQPLVVSSRPRPEFFTLAIHGTKDAVDRAKSHRVRLLHRLGREGFVEPGLADLEGLEVLREQLGAGGRIELDRPLQFQVEREEERPLVLQAGDCELRGAPPPGFDPTPTRMVYRPPVIHLVGPASAVENAERNRAGLLEPVVLFGQLSELTQDVRLSPAWREQVRLRDPEGKEVDAVRVTMKFERRLLPVPAPEGVFERAVEVVYNDDLMRRQENPKQKSAGWRLKLVAAKDGELKLPLQLFAPEAALSDRTRLELAKDSVELIVRASEVAGSERITAHVHVKTFSDFPEGIEVRFAEGTSDEVEVAWTRQEAPLPPSGDAGGDGRDRDGRDP